MPNRATALQTPAKAIRQIYVWAVWAIAAAGHAKHSAARLPKTMQPTSDLAGN